MESEKDATVWDLILTTFGFGMGLVYGSSSVGMTAFTGKGKNKQRQRQRQKQILRLWRRMQLKGKAKSKGNGKHAPLVECIHLTNRIRRDGSAGTHGFVSGAGQAIVKTTAQETTRGL